MVKGFCMEKEINEDFVRYLKRSLMWQYLADKCDYGIKFTEKVFKLLCLIMLVCLHIK